MILSLNDATRQQGGWKKYLPVLCCALIIWAMTFVLHVKASFHYFGEPGEYLSDVSDHLRFAMRLSFADPVGWLRDVRSYPVWHLLVNVFNRLGMPFPYASAFVTAGLNLLAYWVVYRVLKRYLKDDCQETVIAVAALWILLVSAIFIPFINRYMYLTPGSPNPWHNPTHFTVKWTIALLAPLFVYYFQHPKLTKKGNYTMSFSQWAVIAALCFYSVWGKPSLMQAFGPAVVCFLIIELIASKGKAFPFCVATALAFVPVLLSLVLQYTIHYGEETGRGIEIAWRWSGALELGNPVIIRLRLYAFPLFAVLAFELRNIFRNKYLLFSLLLVLVSELECILLHETGISWNHANFRWALLLSAFNLWVVTTICFIKRWMDYRRGTPDWKSFARSTLKTRMQGVLLCGGWLLACMHLLSGVAYYLRYYITLDFL